jgi:hypothetical protein
MEHPMNRSANRFAWVAAAVMAATAPLASSEPAKTADLSPGFHVGQTGQWVITRSFAEKSKALVAEAESAISATVECTTEVRSARDEGGVVVQVVISRLAAEGDGSEWTGSYDSAKPEADDAASRDDFDRALRGLVDRPFELVLDSFGTVIDVRGLDDLQHRDPTAALIAEAVLGIDTLDRSFGPIFAIKPESPFVVPVGEVYTDTCDAVLSVGRVLTRLELTLDAIEGNEARFVVGGRTLLFGNTQTDVSPKITEEELTGTASWNTQAHALTGYDVAIDWTLEAGGKQMPIKIEREETIGIKPKK